MRALFVCAYERRRMNMSENNEIWKPFPGYEDDYEISNLGRVKSHRRGREKILKPIQERYNGYNMVSLFDKNGKSHKIRIGRHVALAFIPNPNNLPCVNHKDEIKTHDYVDNLEWCTKAYNTAYGTARQRAKETMRRNRMRQGTVIA